MALIVSLIFLFSTVYAVRLGRRTWLLVDTIFPLFIGVSLLLTPTFLLHHITDPSNLDFTSYYLARIAGCLLISSSVLSHRAYHTQLRCERAAVAVARTLTSICLLISAFETYLHTSLWHPSFYHFIIIGSICWLVPYFYYSLCICDLGKPQSYRLYTFLVVDHILSKVLAIVWLAFPSWLLSIYKPHPPNPISIFLGRFIGSLLLGISSISLTATGFPASHMKMYIHRNTIFTSAVLLLLVVLGVPWDDRFSVLHLIFGTVSALLWAANATFGYIYLLYIKEGEQHARRLMKPAPRPQPRHFPPSVYTKRLSSSRQTSADSLSDDDVPSPVSEVGDDDDHHAERPI